MRTAALGAVTLAGGLAVAGLLAWTDLGVTAVIVAGLIAMLAAMTGAGLLGLALARADDRRAARQLGQFDDAIAMVTGPSDAEIDQMISNYPKDGQS